jgi:spore germination cell wall hydrolase CwlJ-like protein
MLDAICLAAVIYFEARSEPPGAQAAVASVVLERVENPKYPDTICGVALQRKQFSAFNRGVPRPRNAEAWSAAIALSRAILDDPEGTVPISGATHYHTANVRPYWARRYEYLGRHGAHLFYARTD